MRDVGFQKANRMWKWMLAKKEDILMSYNFFALLCRYIIWKKMSALYDTTQLRFQLKQGIYVWYTSRVTQPHVTIYKVDREQIEQHLKHHHLPQYLANHFEIMSSNYPNI